MTCFQHHRCYSTRLLRLLLIWLLPLCNAFANANPNTGDSGALIPALVETHGGGSIGSEGSAIRFGRGSTWSANTSSGRSFGGTWTGAIDASTGTASGTWTLMDRSGRVLMRGTWSAAKSESEWRGSWRALISGQKREYSGTWSCALDHPPDSPLSGLFEKALQQAVNGTWRSVGQSGGWSVRAARRGD